MHNHSQTGLLIVFEGIDGTGKSTQLTLLAESLTALGFDVACTREPTEGSYGQQIRALYSNRHTVSREEELELFLLDRRQHVSEYLQPALDQGKIILCDRYYLSTVAYQGAAGLAPDMIMEKNAFAPEPDLALLFHISPELSCRRITDKRGDTLNDFEQLDTLRRVADIFDDMQQSYITRIDASQTIETIHESVKEHVMQLIEQKNLAPKE